MTPAEEDEKFECVECFCTKKEHSAPEEFKKKHGYLDCGWDMRIEEYDYWAAHPKEYEAMVKRWPQYAHPWGPFHPTHEQFMKEHS